MERLHHQVSGMNPLKPLMFLPFCGPVQYHARTNPQPIRNQTRCDKRRR